MSAGDELAGTMPRYTAGEADGLGTDEAMRKSTDKTNTAPGGRKTLAEGFSEFARPANGKDWSRLVLGIVLGVCMLLMGRIWGESLLEETTTRAIQNEARIDAAITRFEDHATAQRETTRQVLGELAEIRRLLQAANGDPNRENN